MQERRHSLIAIRSIQIPLILQSVLASFILINLVLIAAFLFGGAFANPVGRIYLGIAVAAVEIAYLVGVFVMARKQSSRIVGPLYRVQELAGRLKTGDLAARAEIRSDDYFREQIGALDEALQELHDRIDGLKQSARETGNQQLEQELDWFRTVERA